MIVDSSAVISILLQEPDADRLVDTVLRADRAVMSAATFTECAVVADRRSAPAARLAFDRIIERLGIEIVPFTTEHAAIAREAYRLFGRGSGHAAGLNLGDCFTYALAAERGEPLLFVGDDFTHTDLAPAPY